MTVQNSPNAEALMRRHRSTIWTKFSIIILGIWLAASGATFQAHSCLMMGSDVITGLLLVFFGARALNEKHRLTPWILCLLGIWLQLAPLLFGAPNAASFINDTLVGALVIAFSVIIPGTPGVVEAGAEIPPGWSYNPSSWAQRLPVAFLAFIAFLLARYMAAFQLGYIFTVWDPVFINGTYSVVTSDISKSFPVSDAGLGSAAYIIEALLALKGGTRRWHTMPWIVALFGFLVVPVGLVSIILIMLQPLVVGYWCFWCLLTALCMLVMIALTVDEVAASIQFMRRSMKAGRSFWDLFLNGSSEPGEEDKRTPELDSSWKKVLSAMCWGVTVPWNLVVSALIGAWLMFSPSFFEIEKSISNMDHILGALIVAFSVIATAEVVRKIRYLNLLFGILIFLSILFFQGTTFIIYSHIFIGLLLVVISLPKGKILERSGK